jgi:DNA helicase-2/ATP-dependent DNA helicase PcrA
MNKILHGLNKEQAEAVQSTEGPMLIMAGAGSGKTKTLTCRIAWLLEQGVPPYKILAITFTNKAAEEMRKRVDRMVGPAAKNVWLFTFHAFCARFLRMEIEKLGGYASNFVIYDTADSKNLLKETLKELNLDEKNYPLASLLSTISNAKNVMLDARAFASQASDFHARKVAEIYSVYEKKLLLNNALDFDDLLLLTIRLLTKDEEVRRRYQEKFSHVLVDEYQDTNHVQYLLTKLWRKTSQPLRCRRYRQSIYGWRGADIQNILDFERDYPEVRVIKLEQNYRSTQIILDAANAVIETTAPESLRSCGRKIRTESRLPITRRLTSATRPALLWSRFWNSKRRKESASETCRALPHESAVANFRRDADQERSALRDGWWTEVL